MKQLLPSLCLIVAATAYGQSTPGNKFGYNGHTPCVSTAETREPETISSYTSSADAA